MSDIPSELFNNILSRLPVESLLLFRGVCKSWRRMIDDPSFIKSHIRKHRQSSGLGQLLVRNENGGRLLSLSLDFINFARRHEEIEVTQVKNLVRRGLPRLTTLPVASCDGLILIHHTDAAKKIWVLWNPLTQEYYELPKCDGCDGDLYLRGSGFGYDSASDDYKVVRISATRLNRDLLYKTLVYSLRFGSWKRVKDFSGDLCWRNDGQGLHLNGVLYWLSENSITALDLGTEDYHQLPLPSLRPEHPERMKDWVMNLDVLSGCLVLSCNYMSGNYLMEEFEGFEGWVMKDDGGGNISWTKLFSFEEELEDDIGSWRHFRPITYSESQKHVLLQNDRVFYWLNTDNNSAKKVRIHDLRGSSEGHFSCQVWQGTLFRLENFVDSKRIERSKKMRAKKRLKLDTTITDAGEWTESVFSCYSSDADDYEDY